MQKPKMAKMSHTAYKDPLPPHTPIKHPYTHTPTHPYTPDLANMYLFERYTDNQIIVKLYRSIRSLCHPTNTMKNI